MTETRPVDDLDRLRGGLDWIGGWVDAMFTASRAHIT